MSMCPRPQLWNWKAVCKHTESTVNSHRCGREVNTPASKATRAGRHTAGVTQRRQRPFSSAISPPGLFCNTVLGIFFSPSYRALNLFSSPPLDPVTDPVFFYKITFLPKTVQPRMYRSLNRKGLTLGRERWRTFREADCSCKWGAEEAAGVGGEG